MLLVGCWLLMVICCSSVFFVGVVVGCLLFAVCWSVLGRCGLLLVVCCYLFVRVVCLLCLVFPVCVVGVVVRRFVVCWLSGCVAG